jgi:hypothetical protein
LIICWSVFVREGIVESEGGEEIDGVQSIATGLLVILCLSVPLAFSRGLIILGLSLVRGRLRWGYLDQVIVIALNVE